MDEHPLLHAANIFERVVEGVEQASSLDPVAARVHEAVTLRDSQWPEKGLSQRYMARPSTSSHAHRSADRLLDLGVRPRHRGRQAARPAAELLVGLGVPSALPTAASGWPTGPTPMAVRAVVDWSTQPQMAPDPALYAWSWNARRKHRHARGVALAPSRDGGNGRRLPRRPPARASRHRRRQHGIPFRPIHLDAHR